MKWLKRLFGIYEWHKSYYDEDGEFHNICAVCGNPLRNEEFISFCDNCKLFELNEQGEAHFDSAAKKLGLTSAGLMSKIIGGVNPPSKFLYQN